MAKYSAGYRHALEIVAPERWLPEDPRISRVINLLDSLNMVVDGCFDASAFCQAAA